MPSIRDRQTIPFDPYDNDVIATKNRSWNMKHVGNIAYRELLDTYMPRVQKRTECTTAEYREMANEIMQTVHRRKGRFLKLWSDEVEQSECSIMEPKAIVYKIMLALKERYRKFASEGFHVKKKRPGISVVSTNMGKKRQADDMTINTSHGRDANITRAERMAEKRRRVLQRSSPASKSKFEASPVMSELPSPPNKNATIHTIRTPASMVRYKARASDQLALDPYALELITLVCNQPENTSNYHRVLDQPLSKYTLETEPDKERHMRLQVRTTVSLYCLGTDFDTSPCFLYCSCGIATWPPKQGTFHQERSRAIYWVCAVDIWKKCGSKPTRWTKEW
jgi:hypothetical protein